MLGAPDDTGNLGVSALMISTVHALARRRPDAELTVFDNGRGVRRGSVLVDDREFGFDRLGLWPSRRYYRPESMARVEIATRIGSTRSPGAAALLSADAVWDLSGGDSFGDLYGSARWSFITRPKRTVLAAGVPLVLLPQTFGPYRTARGRRVAGDIIAGSCMAWARDDEGLGVMRDLLGQRFNPEVHRRGVDVAFGLPTRRPGTDDPLLRRLGEGGDEVFVGVNISGLLLNDPTASEVYGLKLDPLAVAVEVVTWLTERPRVSVVLVPHVRGPGRESDDVAIERLLDVLPGDVARRLWVLPPGLDASETKWVISELDWFFGTRMHSTIAALSSGVPAAAMAYSLKTRGVFGTCGLEDQVVDARSTDTDRAISLLKASFSERVAVRTRLRARLPDVLAEVEREMDVVVGASTRRPEAEVGR